MMTDNSRSDPVGDLLEELRFAPEHLPPALIRRLQASREALTPRLLALVTELAGREKPPDPFSPFSKEGLTTVHAAVFLADFGVSEVARILLPLLLSKQGEEHAAFLEEPVLSFGEQILPRLVEAIRDPSADPYVRISAVSMAGNLAQAYPLYRPEVLPVFRGTFEELGRQGWEPAHLANYLAHNLGRLEDRESEPLIRTMRDRMFPWTGENMDVWFAGRPYPQLKPHLRPRPFRGALDYYRDHAVEAVEYGLYSLDEIPEGYEDLFRGP